MGRIGTCSAPGCDCAWSCPAPQNRLATERIEIPNFFIVDPAVITVSSCRPFDAQSSPQGVIELAARLSDMFGGFWTIGTDAACFGSFQRSRHLQMAAQCCPRWVTNLSHVLGWSKTQMLSKPAPPTALSIKANFLTSTRWRSAHTAPTAAPQS